MIVSRNLAPALRELATTMPVVAVTGPRQSGKTTLCRQAFPDLEYVSLEPLDVRDFATQDPRGFLREHGKGAILDEIQRTPDLFSYLQTEVDENPAPGRFILTGSQQFGLTQSISQSLAGRIAMLHLLPPSLDELARFGPLPEDLWQVVWAGSYPRIYDRRLDPAQWLADYTATFVERDLGRILNVTNLATFTTFLRLVAGRTAGVLNLSSLGSDAGVSHNTARAWISVLETSFLCLRLPAWRRSKRKQAIKSPKIHFVDTGLACHLLGITAPDQLRHHPLRGALFESWVASEILKARLHRRLQPNLFHFRDAKGLEVDLLLEEGGRLTAVEVKSAATIANDFFGPLRRFGADAERTDPPPNCTRRIVYGGLTRQRRNDVDLIPWRQLHGQSW